MIRFTKARWRNFLSTGNEFIELDLDKAQTTLVVGRNGAGKSQFLDVLSFTLFNKAYRKINKHQLVNSITGRETVCEVEFFKGNSHYLMRRGIKPNFLQVFQNGETIPDPTDALVERILGMNQKSFFQVIVLGAALYIPFMQLRVPERRVVVEDLLDLQVFASMGQILKKRLEELEHERDTADQTLSLARMRLSAEERLIQTLKQDTDAIIVGKLDDIAVEEGKVVQLQSTISQLREQHEQYKGQINDASAVSVRTNKLTELKFQLEHRSAMLAREIEFYKRHDSCPSCKQSIDAVFKLDMINEKEKEITELKVGLGKLAEETQKIQTRQTEINSIKDTMSRLYNEASGQNHILACSKATLRGLNNEVKMLQQKTLRVVQDIVPLQEETTRAEQVCQGLHKQKTVMDTAAELLKDQGVRAKVIKRYLPVLNKMINKYLAALEFMCHLEVNEAFEETIKSRYRDEFSYESFSEGEKMRIDLAILFAWRDIARTRNSSSANLLVFDEVLDSSLDQDGADEFLKIVNSLTTNENVIVISHRGDQLVDKFTDVVRFEKTQGFSVMHRG